MEVGALLAAPSCTAVHCVGFGRSKQRPYAERPVGGRRIGIMCIRSHALKFSPWELFSRTWRSPARLLHGRGQHIEDITMRRLKILLRDTLDVGGGDGG